MFGKALTKNITDHSDTEHFSFSFFCDQCGKEWISEEKLFSGGVCDRVQNNTALLLLWSNEHRIAFEEASLEARVQYNRCPKCGNWVCDDCFNLGADVCRRCEAESS